jgi:hypothetical protein
MDETLAMLALEASYFKTGAFRARAVATNIGAYTGTGTGTLTGTAVGALAAQDGVPLVTGDNLFIPEGLPNVNAVDAGPWIVQGTGTVVSSFILLRPTWWLNGAVIGGGGEVSPPLASVVQIGPEGTFWPGTEWKSFAAKYSVVGSADPMFYPGRVTQQITLVAGSKLISNVPIRNATVSNPYNVFFTRSSWILATSTVMYESSAVSAGYLGSVQVYVVGVGSLGVVAATDASIGNVTIQNW